MTWTVDYIDTAKGQLRRLDKQTARRIVDLWMSGSLDGSITKVIHAPKTAQLAA